MKNYKSVICVRSYCSLTLILILTIGVSCKKIVDVDLPNNTITTEAVFLDDKSAIAAVNGLYSRLNGNVSEASNMNFANCGITFLGGLSSDEFEVFALPDRDLSQFQFNTLLKDNSLILTMWKNAYEYLYHANACIEALNANTSKVSENTKRQLLGECIFIRSFMFFYLTNLFGDIPLVTNTDWRINSLIHRTPQSEVYEYIVADLNEAKVLLTDAYPNSQKVRANKWAATALLARVYLFNKDWANGELNASAVIQSGLYDLETDLDNVFLKNSNEAILQLEPIDDGLFTTREGNIFIGGGNYYLGLTNNLLNAFEVNDKRKLSWINEVTNQNQPHFIPYKYKVEKSTSGNITEYYMMLRLAEQYLIRAEARAERDKLMEAVNDLNIIRERAGLPDLSSSLTKSQILSAVQQERKFELFAEWGHRWLDLKRTGTADAILGPLKPNWQATDKLYPLPQSELLLNPNLSQNPGYN